MNSATTGITNHLATDNELAVIDDPLEQALFTRWSFDAQGRRLAESSLQLSGMYCAACAGLIEQALSSVDGVLESEVSASSQRARVRWDPLRTAPSAFIAAVRGAGYGAAPDATISVRALRQAESRAAIWRLFVATFCAMQVMMLATPAYLAGAGDLAPDLRNLLNWSSWVLTLPVLWFSAAPYFAGAWRAVRHRRIGMDVPVALGLAVTFVASTGATFDPGGLFGHEVYFDSLCMFVSFLLGGRYLETRARHRAAASLEDALGRLPESALRVAADGRVETVSTRRLRPGDRVRVPVGQAFAADGTLLEGRTQVDEALLTGESRAVDKAVGMEVAAGSLNNGAPVDMAVQRVGPDTRYEAISALMREALTQRPTLARSADRWATPFLWTVMVLAAGAAAVWSVIDPQRAVWVAVSVLIVTCPCALSLAAPSAMLSAAGALARRGVLLRRLDALEPLARVRHLFIDKTGTLTEDRLQWRSLQRVDGGASVGDEVDLLSAAAALASWSGHPLSKALARATGGGASTVVWTDVKEQTGQGMSGNDDQGVEWRLGSSAWVGAATGSAGSEPDADTSSLWFGCGGRAQVRFDFDESVRDDAASALSALQTLGLQVSLLSGDTPQRVQRVAQRLGIARASGGASPQDKLSAVRELQLQGHCVAMVGDGINDAPVLAQADASFAMGQGALLARANADAVVLSMRLGAVVDAVRLARRTMKVVNQNIAWAAAYNAACVPLALLGWLPPWAAGLGMATSSLVVIGNSLRLSR